MVIVVYSEMTEATIGERLGHADYSYYFVLEEFLPLLERIGTVIRVDLVELRERQQGPPGERLRTYLDTIYERYHRSGEPVVFLSFCPPYKTVMGSKCPTIPVFAWEFPDVPTEEWDGDLRNDWKNLFAQLPASITHSTFARDAVRDVLVGGHEIVSIPAPVFDRFAALGEDGGTSCDLSPLEVSVDGSVTDSWALGLRESGETDGSRALAASAGFEVELDDEDWVATPAPETTALTLEGVVYTWVFNPGDGRKLWQDLIQCFCVAFRNCPDATLVLKLARVGFALPRTSMIDKVLKSGPFDCRVVILDGFLPGDTYAALARRSTYAVNVSRGEGQCLPLMEYMSCGTPAVASAHTGMADYVTAENAFLYETSGEPAVWPHDRRRMVRTFARRTNCESLIAALVESYRVAKDDPARYRRMSDAAREALRRHCSTSVVESRLKPLIEAVAGPVATRRDTAG